MKKVMLCGALVGSCEAFSALATPRSSPTTTIKMYNTPPEHFSYGIRSQARYGVGEGLPQQWAVPAEGFRYGTQSRAAYGVGERLAGPSAVPAEGFSYGTRSRQAYGVGETLPRQAAAPAEGFSYGTRSRQAYGVGETLPQQAAAPAEGFRYGARASTYGVGERPAPPPPNAMKAPRSMFGQGPVPTGGVEGTAVWANSYENIA